MADHRDDLARLIDTLDTIVSESGSSSALGASAQNVRNDLAARLSELQADDGTIRRYADLAVEAHRRGDAFSAVDHAIALDNALAGSPLTPPKPRRR